MYLITIAKRSMCLSDTFVDRVVTTEQIVNVAYLSDGSSTNLLRDNGLPLKGSLIQVLRENSRDFRRDHISKTTQDSVVVTNTQFALDNPVTLTF